MIPATALPCLYSNISIQNFQATPAPALVGQALEPVSGSQILSSQHRKSANALSWNVTYFCDRFQLENIGFLTLTFAQHVTCPTEAQRRLNSLLSNVIKPRYGDYIGVFERQKSGRIHYHLLVNVGTDIRSGFDFDAVSAKDYSSASQAIRDEWAYWRKSAKLYGFGRTELMPIKSTAEAIGRYVGKYIGKHLEARDGADKGVRLVRYSTGARVVSTRFAFLTSGSAAWRAKVSVFAELVSARSGVPATFDGLRSALGPRWAHNCRDFIVSLPVLS